MLVSILFGGPSLDISPPDGLRTSPSEGELDSV